MPLVPSLPSRALRIVALAGAFAAAGAPSALAEAPTPQAVAANAEFLVAAPVPPKPVKVCVVDTGVDLNTDVAAAVVARESASSGPVEDAPAAADKHGTYVAGVIASQPGGTDAVGIWPQAQIVSVRVFDDGVTSVARYLTALNTCRTLGAKVVNLSLGGVDQAPADDLARIGNKITELRDNWDMNVVAGAGNSGGAVGYPAKFADAFAVGATDAFGAFCSFSSRGPELDLSALGCDAELSMAGGLRGSGRGTSFSAPVVSAVLAALRAYGPALTSVQAEALLTSTATSGAAGRRLDAAAAFRAVGLGNLVDAAPPPTSAPTAGAPAAATAQAVAAPAPSAPIERVVQAPAGNPLAELGVGRPRVRSSAYRNGLLTVTVAGVPDFARAIFIVDKRRYTRSSGKLRLRLKHAPKRVSVVIDVPGVGRTAAVRVKVKKAKAKPTRAHRVLKRRG